MKTSRWLVAVAASTFALVPIAPSGAAVSTFCAAGDATIVNALRTTSVDGYIGGSLAFRNLAPGGVVGSYSVSALSSEHCRSTSRLQLFAATPKPPAQAPPSGAVVTGVFSVGTLQHTDVVAVVKTGGATGIAQFASQTGVLPRHAGVLAVRHAANTGPVDVYLDGKRIASNVANRHGIAVRLTNGPRQLAITHAGTMTPAVPPIHVVVGDGSFTAVYVSSRRDGSAVRALTSTVALGSGYRLVTSDGGIFTFGSARFFGSAGNLALASPVVSGASTSSRSGYWLVAADGGVFAFGDAHFFGSAASLPLRSPVVGMKPTPTDKGYWLVTADGGVFAYGDARFLGSVAALHISGSIVDLAPTRTGNGYLLLGTDGGVFAFGDAHFRGGATQTGTTPIALGAPIAGSDYWVMFANGGRTELNATRAFLFPTPNPFPTVDSPMVSMLVTSTAEGLWTASGDGGVFALGNAGFYGNLVNTPHNAPIVAII
ncbi:MAG: Esterase [Actinomycetia bacterium]|nr:Esterase [Actinomycetes bacterium]